MRNRRHLGACLRDTKLTGCQFQPVRATLTRYYLWSLPLALVAVFLGRVVNRRLDGRSFRVYVHCGLIVVGLVLLVQSVLWA